MTQAGLGINLYPVLAFVFFLTLVVLVVLIFGFIAKPSFWRKNHLHIQFFALSWVVPYILFIYFFTGPGDLSLYPPAANSHYKLPWAAGVSRFVVQGNRSFVSHRDFHFYAWDFVMPAGTKVQAARSGKVITVEDRYDGIGPNSNFVEIRHDDGQRSLYAHIRYQGSLVKVGDEVKQGQPIAFSGMVGQALLPHLHFLVINEDGTSSIPISFSDVAGSDIPSGVPLAGHFYKSGNTTKQGLRSHVEALFERSIGCFIVKKISTGETVESHNPKRCGERFSPNSTFKIPVALMAFEMGVLKDENQIIKWDGQQSDREELNQDQTPVTWMDRSVVWVTRWITPQLKKSHVAQFLKDFNYGNRDFSGGTLKAWLDSSLEISADEQVSFLTNFWQERLPLSRHTFEKTKKIIFIKKLNPTAELYGKTGTGCVDSDCQHSRGRMRGWFVGVVKTDQDAYVFAANATDERPESQPTGPRLRKAVTQFFQDSEILRL